MHSPRGHSSENGLGVFQLGVTPFAYNTRVNLKSLFATLSLSNNFHPEIYDCFLHGETLRKIDCFSPPFVIDS
jgi:hypothetical protein